MARAQVIDEQMINKALIASFMFHCVLLALKLTLGQTEIKPTEAPIEVKFIKLQEIVKPEVKPIVQKAVTPKSPLKEKHVVREIPKKKVEVGTKKIVPKSERLGNKQAKTVKRVQKGDPTSKNFTKYDPKTDFRKTQTTSIGTGAGAKFEGAKLGGGSGDTYKGLDFATKSLTGRLGKRFSANKIIADDFGAGAGKGGGIGDGLGKGFGDGAVTGTTSGTIQTAKILTNVGSLNGATVGAIDSSKGSDGLSKKGAILLSGDPSQTVVLGGMDPDVIRKILLEHLAQFRYCYQSELESAESELSGVVQLNFMIGPNGNVTKTAVAGGQKIPGQVKGCVAGVLRGIQFPEPKGQGLVEVKQPMNFYPRKI